jgi:hypothetical protein
MHDLPVLGLLGLGTARFIPGLCASCRQSAASRSGQSTASGPIGTGTFSVSGPEQDLPSADKELPASPQPQREQRLPPGRVAHYQPEDAAQGGNASHSGQGQALPGQL